MELIIPFDSQLDSPFYEQIYQYIKSEVRRGKLEVGNHLPSTRTLARNLRLSRSTIQMAYGQLLSEGYIEALSCKGHFVCKIEELVEVRQKGRGSFVEPGDTGEDCHEVDFSSRGINLDNFPFNIWRKISRSTLVDDSKKMFAAGDLQRERAPRTTTGDCLYSARGVGCRPEQTLIGVGGEYLLMLLPQILGNGGEIAMEDPIYKQAYRVPRGEGYPVIPVDMDRYGMDVERLTCSSADVAYVMPPHQYPTGTVMSVKRRQELLAWVYSGADRYLIEDDYGSEFRYKEKPIPVLQGMDRGGRAIYMGTFSKFIAPAIRVGFMVLPERPLEAYQERADFYLSTVSRIDQSILYQFITQGYYERHSNRMRTLYRGKHDALTTGFKELEDRFLIRGEYAGLHVLLTHRQGGAEERLVAHTAALGVKVYGISGCSIQPEANLLGSTVTLRYVSLSEKETRKGTKLLAEAWISQDAVGTLKV